MKVKLNIDTISEKCYQGILSALRKQFGEGNYGEWELIADKESGQDDAVIEQYMKYDYDINS